MTQARAVRSGLSHAAALLAVVLLTLAGVRAGVMQAAAASPVAEACLDGAGHGARHGVHHAPGDAAAHAGCEFCVATAVAPLAGSGPAVVAPAAVSWAFPPARGLRGPRGPPAFQPRARGPPSLLTA